MATRPPRSLSNIDNPLTTSQPQLRPRGNQSNLANLAPARACAVRERIQQTLILAMAYPHHRGRHCQQIVHVGLGVGGPGHRHRRSRSCPCSTCRISRRSNTTASSSIKMIDQPNSKKQGTTGTMTNGSSACSNKPRRLHQILTRAYLPPNHAAARNKIVSPPPDHENESLTPNVVSPEESVAYLGADYPLPSPSPSRIIKIPREDNNDIENRAYEQSECDAATWKMCKLMNFLVVRLRPTK